MAKKSTRADNSHLGPALVRDEATLAAMTTPEAMQKLAEKAAANWRAKMPPEYKNLLDAKPET